MEKVTYIIPLHEFGKEVKEYLKRAVESIDNLEENDGNKVMYVGKKEIIEKAAKNISPKNELILVENDGETDFFSQINKAVLQCVTPYFSVLEFDDAYKPYWNRAAQSYASKNAAILIPINEYQIKGEIASFGNEIIWSPAFANRERESGLGLGFIDLDCLTAYMDFNITGALIRTEDFISVGGFKPSLKIAAWYEFLLRTAYNGKRIFVVPKIGYEHTIEREGSFSDSSFNTISKEEGTWLINTAKQEYFFKEDRNLKYEGK